MYDVRVVSDRHTEDCLYRDVLMLMSKILICLQQTAGCVTSLEDINGDDMVSLSSSPPTNKPR